MAANGFDRFGGKLSITRSIRRMTHTEIFRWVSDELYLEEEVRKYSPNETKVQVIVENSPQKRTEKPQTKDQYKARVNSPPPSPVRQTPSDSGSDASQRKGSKPKGGRKGGGKGQEKGKGRSLSPRPSQSVAEPVQQAYNRPAPSSSSRSSPQPDKKAKFVQPDPGTCLVCAKAGRPSQHNHWRCTHFQDAMDRKYNQKGKEKENGPSSAGSTAAPARTVSQ